MNSRGNGLRASAKPSLLAMYQNVPNRTDFVAQRLSDPNAAGWSSGAMVARFFDQAEPDLVVSNPIY
ncbi:MAG: hypothetical protein O3A24_07210 [Actinobacteria bacterium]|nr:hypothetical protein [Actinomycetota bacterium]MDA2998599.1 hypothetical protein [Actinomycetota bacterium]